MITISDKSKCCGCSACQAVCPVGCITMKEDGEGFLYPHVDESRCIDCHRCEKVCPVLNHELCKKDRGYEKRGYLVQHKDRRVLRESTAGGAFTAIAQFVLSKGGVVYGVSMSEDLYAHPSPAKHIRVDKEKDLELFRNSKYIQSHLGKDIYDLVARDLRDGKYVCFSGTPCQAAAVHLYLENRGIDTSKLLLVDVVCRAVPSPEIFRKYLEYQEEACKDKVSKVRFRDKHYGYSHSTMNVSFSKSRREYHRGIESDKWLRAYFSNICDRPSCHECRFRSVDRVSDLTIWDCFNSHEFTKEMDNNAGVSRMILRSRRAADAMEHIRERAMVEEFPVERLTKGVAELSRSVPPHEKREVFFRDASVMKGGYELFTKYYPDTPGVILSRTAKMACVRLGIYAPVKRVIKKLLHG